MNYSSLLQDAWVDQLSYSAEEQLENFDDRSMDCSELEWELETEGDRFIDLTITNFPSETKSIGAFLELIGSRIAEQTDVRSFFEQFCDYHDLGDPDICRAPAGALQISMEPWIGCEHLPARTKHTSDLRTRCVINSGSFTAPH